MLGENSGLTIRVGFGVWRRWNSGTEEEDWGWPLLSEEQRLVETRLAASEIKLGEVWPCDQEEK